VIKKIKNKNIINEAEESKSISKAIARLSVLLGNRSITAGKNRLPKINIALLLLNQAQTVVGSDPREASKLLAIARRIKTSGDVKSESFKKRKKIFKDINEYRKRKILSIVTSING